MLTEIGYRHEEISTLNNGQQIGGGILQNSLALKDLVNR
jgi:hypothetical protein